MVSISASSSFLYLASSSRRGRRLTLLRCLKPPGSAASCRRLQSGVPQCCMTSADIGFTDVSVKEDVADPVILTSDCSTPFVHLSSEILSSELSLLTEEGYKTDLLAAFPVLTKEEQNDFSAVPAHPAGLYVLYASCLVGNLAEQVWNFTWPAAVAMLHPSLLPVAAVGFFTKLAIFAGGPLVGSLMDSLPRIPSYHCLNVLQAASQLVAATTIIYAFTAVRHATVSVFLQQPWFIVLMVATAAERLAAMALGITMERDWIVLLAGMNRPIALAQANATISRLDLLCEMAGASLFAFLLSKYDPATCIKLACILTTCTLPILIILGQLINGISSGVLDRPASISNKYSTPGIQFNAKKSVFSTVGSAFAAMRHGWQEYRQQPVLPASVAYVLLCFNIALAPGALMTTFLVHHGATPSIIGAFSGLSALMGVGATFVSATLVEKLGILKAGAAGLTFQALVLMTAVGVYVCGSISRPRPMLIFLSLIVLSRLGHMAYSVVSLQIVQTGVPAKNVNLVGVTEVSISSLAELIMLGVAIVANDVSHFRFLAMLSVSSVVGATLVFCGWLANPTDEQRRFFSHDPQF